MCGLVDGGQRAESLMQIHTAPGREQAGRPGVQVDVGAGLMHGCPVGWVGAGLMHGCPVGCVSVGLMHGCPVGCVGAGLMHGYPVGCVGTGLMQGHHGCGVCGCLVNAGTGAGPPSGVL